jgi:hypothetical protein
VKKLPGRNFAIHQDPIPAFGHRVGRGFLQRNKFNLLKAHYTIIEIQKEEKIKILKGLEIAYQKLLEFKQSKNSELVVLRDHKIVKIKPE